MEGRSERTDLLPAIVREYLSGSIASSITATMFSPVECVKTRLMLQDMPGSTPLYTQGFVRALLDIWRQDGLVLMWSHGLLSMALRDFFYSGVRTGMYPSVRGAIAGDKPVGEITLFEKIAAGALTGGIGAGLANPFDVVRVRMMMEGGKVDAASGRLLTGMRAGEVPHFPSSLHCARDAIKSEGFLCGLMLRGVGPSMSRASLLTASQLSSYDHTKVVMKRRGWMREGPALHLLAALLSGAVATVTCNPADVLKSRLMSTRVTNPGSNALEATSIGVAREIWQHEGVRGFFRGVLPAYARIGPIIFLQMPIVEALRSAFGVRAL